MKTNRNAHLAGHAPAGFDSRLELPLFNSIERRFLECGMGGFLNARVGNLAGRIHNKKDTDNAFEFFTAHFIREGRRSLKNGAWFLIYFSKVERAINTIANAPALPVPPMRPPDDKLSASANHLRLLVR